MTRPSSGVNGIGLQPHQVHHVDHPDLQFGQVLAQQRDRGHRLQRGDVAAARQHHVGCVRRVVRGKLPDPGAAGAVDDGLVRQGMPRVTFSHLACWLNIESMMWMNAS
jgi:hypothetical protein